MISKEARDIVINLKSEGVEISSTQIRKLLVGINGIHNRILAYQAAGEITDDKLPPKIIDELDYMKIRMIYQSRDQIVKKFIEKAQLVQKIDDIGDSKKKFKDYNRFLEAIVAYHKFEGEK